MEQVLGQWISEKELGNTHYMKAMRLNIVNQGDIFNGEIILACFNQYLDARYQYSSLYF